MQIFIADNGIAIFRRPQILMLSFLISFLFFICSSLTIFAQTTPLINSKLVGKVVEEKTKDAIPGAVVHIKGTTHSVSTDSKGRFEFVTGQKFPYTLEVSYVGYEKVEVIADGSTLTVALKESSSSLNEVVVVGYGTQQKANLTGAVATLDFKDIENSPQASTTNILSGRLPGVAIVQGGGQPGNDEGEITIRGTTGLTGSSVSPLVIIDGIQSTPRDLANLAPQEIANITVLKDAASASIYGSRGGNGVILVTTKLPKKEGLSINFGAYTAFQEATYLPELVESWQFMQLHNEATDATGINGSGYPLTVIDSARNGLFSDNIANTKWFEEIFRTAPMQNYNLGVSGRSQGTAYQVSATVQNQEGILRGTSSDRYTIRGNLKSNISKFISAGLNINGFLRTSNSPFRSTNLILQDANRIPLLPVRYANGEFAVYNRYTNQPNDVNPVLATEIGYNNEEQVKINFQPSLIFKINDDLKLNTSLTYSVNFANSEQFNPTYSYNSNYGIPAYVNNNSRLNTTSNTNKQLQLQTTLNYNKVINQKHALTGLLGHEYLDFKSSFRRAQGDNLPSNELPVLDNATSAFLVNGNKGQNRLQSFFGRATYAYNNKYLIEANLRYDGSSVVNGRYRASPSASAGWVISSEEFYKPIIPVVSFLKFRAGYGSLGNDTGIADFTYLQTLSFGTFYNVGGALQAGTSITSFGNSDINWERTTTTNLGLDAGFLKDKLLLNFDLYQKVTDGILFRLPLPLYLGSALPPVQNIGKVSNKGLEVNLTYKDNVQKFNYYFGLNYAFNKNNVEKLNGQRIIDGSTGLTLIQEGLPIGSWYGFVNDGLYTQTDQDNNYPKFEASSVIVGSLKFLDLNNDGKINDLDREVIGDGSTPHIFGVNGGFSYEGFDFNFLLQGVAGKDIYINDVGNRPANGGQLNFWKEWFDRRFEPIANPSGDWPILKRQGPEANASSSFWIRNASYIRLKNLEVGYTFKNELIRKIGLKSLRLFSTAQNVLAFSTVPKNLDPERSNFQKNNTNYPQTRIYSFGINANL